MTIHFNYFLLNYFRFYFMIKIIFMISKTHIDAIFTYHDTNHDLQG